MIALDTRLAIRQARSIIEKFEIYKPPVPVDQIAERLDIRLQYVTLDDELSGMAFIQGKTKAIIVNAGHHPNRQRFTVAHELGHHLLHQDYLALGVHVDKGIMRRDKTSRFGNDAREIEANAFAAELLMPVSLMKPFKDIDAADEVRVAIIARQFKVSAAAVSFRLINIF